MKLIKVTKNTPKNGLPPLVNHPPSHPVFAKVYDERDKPRMTDIDGFIRNKRSPCAKNETNIYGRR